MERVEVDYAVVGPWATGGLGVRPSRVRLVRPVLRATWANGKLSLGRLDPLLAEFTGKPPRPDSRSPLIVVEQGRLALTSQYGALDLGADARIDNGKLMRLSAVLPPAALKSGDIEAQGLTGRLELTTTGDRVHVATDLSAGRFAIAGVAGANSRLKATADLPYPDLKTRRGNGKVAVGLTLTGDRIGFGDTVATKAVVQLGFDGGATGWIETLHLVGDLSGEARATRLSGAGLAATTPAVRLDLSKLDVARAGQDVRWSLAGPARATATQAELGGLAFRGLDLTTSRLTASGRNAAVSADGPLQLRAAAATFGDLALDRVTGAADLSLAHDGATRVEASGSLKSGDGRWPLFGPPTADDVPELTAMKAALGDFAVDVPAFRVTAGTAGTRVVLTAPARLVPANGGVLTVQPVARPIYSAAPGQLGGGALKVVATRGQGLPEAVFDVPAWSLTPGGFRAALDGRAALDFGVARGLTVTTAGELVSDTGVLTYSASRCAAFTAERLELGENDVMDLTGQACASGRPVVTVRQGGWRADLALRDVTAKAPFLALDVDRIQGTATATGGPSGLGLVADIASARVVDATTPRRFNPLSATGRATLRDEQWAGGFDLRSGIHPVAHLDLAHNGLTERGGVTIATGDLTFAQGGLQPLDLTPMVAGLVSPPVTGSVSFTGRFDWDPAAPEGSSSGRLIVPGLDFVSPAGPVKGLKGTIDFTNLAPLVTAPGQTLTVDSLETITPLTDLDLTFALDKAAITVSGGEIQVAGGTIRVEPFSVPLDRAQPFGGVIVFERVQLGELIKGAGFDDKVSLDAVVSGRLPFAVDPKAGVRIAGGTLYAVQPGRLSIQRTALTGLEAGGGGTEVPPGTVEDLAYQAMENLAFSTLSAQVNSLDQGRISVLFSVKGRHDPPQRQELRIPLPELISRQFLNHTLPLPSDTGIDLTLDTTLNLDQLVGDILAINRARNGEADAPAATPAPVPEAGQGTPPVP